MRSLLFLRLTSSADILLSVISDYNDPSVSVVLGYICHVLVMSSIFLQVPLRHPVKHLGSRSVIYDQVYPDIPDKEREYVYFRSRRWDDNNISTLAFYWAILDFPCTPKDVIGHILITLCSFWIKISANWDGICTIEWRSICGKHWNIYETFCWGMKWVKSDMWPGKFKF